VVGGGCGGVVRVSPFFFGEVEAFDGTNGDWGGALGLTTIFGL